MDRKIEIAVDAELKFTTRDRLWFMEKTNGCVPEQVGTPLELKNSDGTPVLDAKGKKIESKIDDPKLTIPYVYLLLKHSGCELTYDEVLDIPEIEIKTALLALIEVKHAAREALRDAKKEQ